MSRRDAPTAEQLLNLADRAEDGPLSAAEAARLRLGLRALAATARRSGAKQRRITQLEAELTELRRQLAGPTALLQRATRQRLASVRVESLAQALDSAPGYGEAA